MLTHGRPLGLVDTIPPALRLLDTTDAVDHKGCRHLAEAVRRAKPRLHCFGHIHDARGALRVSWEEQGVAPALKASDDGARFQRDGNGEGDGDKEAEGENGDEGENEG